jgi:hypothetical protein
MRSPSSLAAVAAVTAGLALLAATPAAQAAQQTLKIEFSNLPSFDEAGSVDNVGLVYTLAPQAYITGLSWSVDIAAYDPSWLSELTLDLTSSSGEGVQLSPGDGSNVAGNMLASGQLDLVNNGLAFRLKNDGRLLLSFYDAVNDLPGADGRWNAGVLQVNYTAPVPEPASAGLLLAGLLATATWRRRAAARQSAAH